MVRLQQHTGSPSGQTTHKGNIGLSARGRMMVRLQQHTGNLFDQTTHNGNTDSVHQVSRTQQTIHIIRDQSRRIIERMVRSGVLLPVKKSPRRVSYVLADRA